MPAITEHQLSLEIPEITCPDRIRIWDSSVYADSLLVDCETLDILMPGYSQSVQFLYTDSPTPLEYGFDRIFTAVDLGLQAQGSTTLKCLPDGLWVIQYSVSPNNVKYVKYYHLRTVEAMLTYYKELCKLQLAQCEPTAQQKQHLADLRYIKMLLDAAKAKAEYCHAPDQAVAMLQYANSLMKKYQDGCCITCS